MTGREDYKIITIRCDKCGKICGEDDITEDPLNGKSYCNDCHSKLGLTPDFVDETTEEEINKWSV